VEGDTTVKETIREVIVRARRGQGLFKQRVMLIETRCRITGVDNPNHLLASHYKKPWRGSTNEERLNGENGLLLTPSIDHLFDRGFIGFEDSGRLIISPVAHKPSLQRMGVETDRLINVGRFTEGQRRFLEFHRDAVLLRPDSPRHLVRACVLAECVCIHFARLNPEASGRTLSTHVPGSVLRSDP
jgi:putative restriction endonuclease